MATDWADEALKDFPANYGKGGGSREPLTEEEIHAAIDEDLID